MKLGRRSLIASFGALAAATGCLDGNGEDGNGTGDGTNGTNGTDDDTNGDGTPNLVVDYATWMFDPETAGRDIEEHNISYREPSSIPAAARDGTVERFDAYDRFVSVAPIDHGAFVFDFASESVFVREMEGWGLTEDEPVEERGNYAVYDVEDSGTTFGVDFEEMLVIASGHDGVTRAIVDTRLGDAEPYTRTNEDMGLLLGTLGEGHIVEAGDGGFSEDGVAAGSVRDGNEDGTVDVRAAEVFPDEGTVNTGAFEEGLLSEFEENLDDDTLKLDEVRQDGRVAVATGTSESGIYIQL
jgi:hypothetical protein